MLDTTHSIETPEGVEIDLRPAGPFPRALAWLIDFALRIAGIFAIFLFSSLIGPMGWGVALIVFFIAEWLYPVFFEVFFRGRTPGKKAMSIAVVHQDGTPVGWGASLLRNLLRTVDSLPYFPLFPEIGAGLAVPVYGVGLLAVLMNRRFQRLGDLVAGTLVVYEEKIIHSKIETLDIEPAPPPLSLSLPEQRALISYSERAGRLTEGRTAELADILSPLTAKTGVRGVRVLHKWAAWFMGARK